MFWRKQKNTDSIIDYIALLGILAGTFFSIRMFGLARMSVMAATIPLSIGYIAWGILHHKKHGHIDRKILLEYVGLALLVNIVIFTLVI